MLNVSQAVKDAYANPSSGKRLIIYFPDYDITVDPDTVYAESFKLNESIMDMASIEFVGCNPSKMQVQIQDFGYDVKGSTVQVFMQVDTGTTEDEPIPLFKGTVDSVTQQSNKRIKELVAYDVLYTKGNADIAQWYIHQFQDYWEDGVTIKDFRDALFEHLEIEVEDSALVNDEVLFQKQYSPVNMKALDVIKYICQINGVFGIINRYGKFEYRVLTPIEVGTTPSPYVEVRIYKQIDYQEFTVKPVDKLTIRQSDLEEGVSIGIGTNNYIIQGNFFTLNMTEEQLTSIAENIYPLISDITYVPYKVTQVGYPWLECGDIVEYEVYDFEASQAQHEDIYKPMKFYIFERYLTGIQALRDEYEAQGEEEQSVFITNINAQIDTIRDQIEAIQGRLDSIELKYLMFYNMGEVDVEDGTTRPVVNTRFGVAKSGQIHIEMEYLIECETTEEVIDDVVTNNDLKVKLLYEFDGEIIDSREPVETYQDGKHILSAYYILNVDNQRIHTWKVWMNCQGGNVHIDIFQAQNSILGLNILGNTGWDGTIDIREVVNAIELAGMVVADLTDNAIVAVQTPVDAPISDTLSSIDVDGINLASVTDNVGINEVVTNYWVDETTADDMTYDDDYVIIDNHDFVLKTEFTTMSTSVVIDDGFCTKVTPMIDSLATIESVVINEQVSN